MEKSKIIKPMKIAAFPSSGSDDSRVLTCFLIVLLAFILLSGLITLKILNGFKFILTAIISKILNGLLFIKNLPGNNNNKVNDIPWLL